MMLKSKGSHFLCTIGVIVLVLALMTASATSACTTFQLKHGEEVYFGRNYDWGISEALIVVNLAGMEKPGFPHRKEKGERATWTSRYGSVSFNQYGRDLSTGGMNSAGLVVEAMMLPGSRLPEPDERPYLATSHFWRQYVLDNFATVSEVVENVDKVRIAPSKAGTHYLVSDPTGDIAVLEYLDGKLFVYRGDSLPIPVLSNSAFAESIDYMEKGVTPEEDRWNSIKRFRTAAAMVRDFSSSGGEDPVEYSYRVLKAVANPDRTQWRVVYDQTRKLIHYRTKKNSEMRTIDLGKLDFSCAPQTKMIHVDAGETGDVTAKMVPYTYKANREMIGFTFANTSFLAKTPPEFMDKIASYPDSFNCKAR